MARIGLGRVSLNLALIFVASIVGSVGITVALVRIPWFQSVESGNAGQAYGAAAATASVVVLVFIARTFQQQAEESRIHREESRMYCQVLEGQRAELALQREATHKQGESARCSAEAALRAQHQRLLELALRDPLLMEVWPSHDPTLPQERKRQYMYANLIISHHYMCHTGGSFTEEEISVSLRHIFSAALMREFWEWSSSHRQRTIIPAGSMAKFYAVAEQAYLERLP
ncbi:DUF6082 family protein [Streptomyces sp. NPDC060205]|uniref:DUF6082 family protein n=1 Tax=Streptomyces sp. NPDC060205 TaxID=3347072 RepID=UPI003665AE1F